MHSANYSVNQFSLVDEKNEALTQLLANFSWQDEPLLKLSLPLFPQIDAISCIDDNATLDAFRHNLVSRLKQLKAQGQSLNLSPQLLDKLSFMWAAFLDERVIYESDIDTTAWENNTLVSQLFGIRNSGETFFTLVKQLMNDPSHNLELLQISYLLLQLGFKGKYHGRRAIELNQFIAEVSHALSEFGVLQTQNHRYSAYSKVVKKPYRMLLKPGIRPKWFWLTCIVVLTAAIGIYQQELSELYANQQDEYREMAKETRQYLTAIQPKNQFIEQKDFISQGSHLGQGSYIGQPSSMSNDTELVVTKQQPSDTAQQQVISSAPVANETTAILSTEISQPITKPKTGKRYLVQLGVYDRESAAQQLTSHCSNDTYPLQFGHIDTRTFVGYVTESYAQANTVSQFFQNHCQLVPYIKEYKP
ncbi:DotU family type IV/VI secretion system protein [Thalassotalea euphylliae]|uniref:DotU family type IV/VI secretion system protein n=1 Tax=Thalassotalea euphylliae TaxID=1655234 RepID=A0A3E0U3D6_9GAMM|nr:DotU family type IV/VI secretion system protein [Thalassotalea euphylliae]REL30715.1 DotU family type IV/VI secretion system protein [Thalassotalea euphylliae]